MQELIMTLYDDIIKEQGEIEKKAADLLEEIYNTARSSVEEGDCAPIVASMVGNTINYYHPKWRNDFERGKVFENINAEMEDLNILACVAALHGSVARSCTSIEDPRNHPNTLPAIILIARLAWGQQVMVYPYRKDGEEIEWLDEIPLDKYSSLLEHPCVN
jgi:hypothetical protein